MKVGDVEITVTGLPFTEKAVSGISISYGYNSIPVARLQLDAPYISKNAPAFLCDPDSYKKRATEVKISVKAKTGCLNFTGYFDGLNIVQTPGGFDYSAIIKNKFQRLMEIYPKASGVWPGSVAIYKTLENLRMTYGRPEDIFVTYRTGLYTKIPLEGLAFGVFLKYLLVNLLNSQIVWEQATSITENTNALYTLINDTIYHDNINVAIPLLENIDTTAIEKCDITSEKCADSIAQLLISEQSNLWDLMVSAYQMMGCIIVPANDQLFIVPESGFIKTTNSVPQYRETSTVINHAYPADFNNLMVNDNGFVNLKYCYLAPGLNDMPGSFATTAESIRLCLGIYPRAGTDPEIPDDGSSGILIIDVPPFLMTGLVYGCSANDEVQQNLSDPDDSYSPEDLIGDPDQVIYKYEDYEKNVTNHTSRRQEILDQWAKSKFLQAKYAERGGSFNCVFNPNWVPGSTGSLYTRQPGLFFNFFVTGVNHTISLSVPNAGTAVTQINFGSVRYSHNPGDVPGVAADEFFKYTSNDMAAFQQQWVNNINGRTLLAGPDYSGINTSNIA